MKKNNEVSIDIGEELTLSELYEAQELIYEDCQEINNCADCPHNTDAFCEFDFISRAIFLLKRKAKERKLS